MQDDKITSYNILKTFVVHAEDRQKGRRGLLTRASHILEFGNYEILSSYLLKNKMQDDMNTYFRI